MRAPAAIYYFRRTRKKDGSYLKSRFDCVRKKGEYQLPPLEQSMARTLDTFTIYYREPLENRQGGTNPNMTIWAPSMPEMGKGRKAKQQGKKRWKTFLLLLTGCTR